ncbi:anaphase-promoting complex component apc8, variant 2 [Trifolium repens]|nr:anaphase-promoting complex component apc8, variant 2 [Trifolium repens]
MNYSRESYRSELSIAFEQLNDRCLYSASNWTTEHLVGIEQDPSKSFTPSNTRSICGSSLIHRKFRKHEEIDMPTAGIWTTEHLVGIEQDSSKSFTPSNTGSSLCFMCGNSCIHRNPLVITRSFHRNPLEITSGFHQNPHKITGGSYIAIEDELADSAIYRFARSFFHCRQYRRAAHVLRDQIDMKSLFLRFYALYLAGEKRKEEEMIEIDGPLGKGGAVNRELVSLERELSALCKNGTVDPFGLYLYGLILKQKNNANLARTVLVESVNYYPWNWNAWTELQSLCTSVDILNSLNLRSHWMKDFFLASVYQKLRMHKESRSKYEYLLGIFGYSNYIHAQIAKGHYSLREFDQVERIFEELLRTDPYRVEDLDMYSNVLYTKECFSALSCLAHRVLMIDKYSPESCCIIGNYYSSKGKHEESVKYFSRALKLNKNYASAWTLMGHEFIELKNIAAAVNAYRQAVEIDEGDYRAWYGLGQAYELTGMPLFALKYYKESVSRQPNDPRLWIAMAKCYENDQFRMLDKAIKCYERAANYNDSEAIALHQLAKLHSELGCPEKAAFYYRKDLEKMESEERDGPNMVEAWIYLAKYYKSTKRFEEAEVYCTRLLDYTGPEREAAKSLLREIRSTFPPTAVDHFPP